MRPLRARDESIVGRFGIAGSRKRSARTVREQPRRFACYKHRRHRSSTPSRLNVAFMRLPLHRLSKKVRAAIQSVQTERHCACPCPATWTDATSESTAFSLLRDVLERSAGDLVTDHRSRPLPAYDWHSFGSTFRPGCNACVLGYPPCGVSCKA